MAVLLVGIVWTGVVAWLLLRALRQFRAHRAVSQPMTDAAGPRSPVAVIVPMRDEIANAERCLRGLRQQAGLPGRFSIIVVDDESQDGTGAVAAGAAAADPRVSLLRPGPLPAGWMGKPYACWCGALAADAEWLCFVDADVRAAPRLMSTAIAAAQAEQMDMLSLAPFQLLGSFWERLIMPAGLLLVACAADLRSSGDREAADIAVNGQFLLIRRTVYFAVGGHAAVRGEVAEDKALAVRVRRAGWRYAFRDAGRLAQTRMYRDLPSLWYGLAKNAVDILGSASATLAAAAIAFVIGWATWLVPVWAGLAVASATSAVAVAGLALCLGAALTVLALHVATARHFRIAVQFGLLFPLAHTAVAILALHSVLLRRAGKVSWKGRVYKVERRVASGGR